MNWPMPDRRTTSSGRAKLAQAIWFFLPPIWWIRDQMKLDQEFLADRGAVEQFGTSGRYASTLVDLASSTAPDHRPLGRRPTSEPRVRGSPLRSSSAS